MPNALGLLADPRGEMRASPRNKLMGLLADALTAANDYAQKPDPTMPMGKANPVLGLLADALPLSSLATTAQRASYGEPLTNGLRGSKAFLKPETADVAMMAPISPRNALAALGAIGGAADTGAMRAMLAAAPRAEALKTAQRNAAKPISEGGLGLHPNNTAAERAQAMGFTTEAFHGTPDDALVNSGQFSNDMLGKATGVSDARMGHFTAANGDAASEFVYRDGGIDGGNVLPLMIAGDRASVSMPGEWAPGKYDNVLFQSKRGKYDGLDIKGATTLGKPGDYRVVFDPKNIRSRFAAFDPFQRNSANLLAGVGAGGLGLSFLFDDQAR